MTKLYIALEQALAVVSQHGQGWKAEIHLAGNNTQCIAADPLRPEHGVPGDAVNPPRLRLAGAPMSAIRDPRSGGLPSAHAPACGSARDRLPAVADRRGPVHGSDVVLKKESE